MKIAIALVTIAGILELTGCKPKETTLSGQVFIVTQGADNVKLGDVEILLIEKTQVTDFLHKKQPAIDSEIATKQQELTKLEQGVVTVFLKTNADYVKAESEFDELQKQFDDQLARMNQAVKDYSNNPDHADAVSSDAEAKSKVIQLKMQSALDQMKAAKSAAMKSLKNHPTAADYFEDFLPVIAQKTISDADGKFSFVYPRDKSFAIFTSAQRMVLNKTEKYYWLVNTPANAESVQIFLSNNNLAEVDPDGYFALKPKAEVQESPDVNAQ
jgi:hypothetical protein